MNRQRKNKGDRRRHTERFARLPHRLLSSPAYRALSSTARALLVEFAMMENGKNNGLRLFLSVRDAADRLGVADLKAVTNALTELQQLGFLEMTHEAHFAVKAGNGSRARFWRLTWEAVPGVRGPTNEFENRQPGAGTRSRKRMEKGLRALKRWKQKLQNAVQDTSTHIRQCVEDFATSNRERVEQFSTQNLTNTEKQPISVADKTSTYTAVPAEGGSGRAAIAVTVARPLEELGRCVSRAC